MDNSCCDPGPKFNFECDNFKYSYTQSRVRPKTPLQWARVIEDDLPWDYWCQEGQELRQFNEKTKQVDRWVATKQIMDLADKRAFFIKVEAGRIAMKNITAQANFEWLNQQ